MITRVAAVAALVAALFVGLASPTWGAHSRVLCASTSCFSVVQSINCSFDAPPTHVPSTNKVDAPISGNGDVGVVVAGGANLTQPLTVYLSMNQFWNTKLDGESFEGYGFGGVRQVGGLSFSFPSLGGGASAFSAVQTISDAHVQTKHSFSSTGSLSTDTVALMDSHLVVTRLEASEDVDLSVKVWTVNGLPLSRGFFNPSHMRTATSARGLFITRDTAPQYYAHRYSPNAATPQAPYLMANVTTAVIATAPFAEAAGGGLGTPIAFSNLSQDGLSYTGVLALKASQPVLLVTAMLSSRDLQFQTDPLQFAQSRLLSLSPSSLASARTTHAKWWQGYWQQSCISIPASTLVERYWYGSQYLLAISSQPGKVAPGLWGPFITKDNPDYLGDYTLNYNYQATYYGAFSSNHLDQILPYFQPISDFVPVGQVWAKNYYGCPGVVYPGHMGPWGMITSSRTAGQLSNAAFASVHFLTHFYYSRDVAFLNTTAYPMLKEVADFWVCYLQKKQVNGTYYYYIENDCVNELCGTSGGQPATNNIITLSFLHYIFNGLITASTMLNIDANERTVWADILAHLPPFPTGIAGYRGHNWEVFAPSQGSPPQGQGANPFETYVMFPTTHVGLNSSAAELTIAHHTITHINSWGEGNAFPQIFPSAVRVNWNQSELILVFEQEIKAYMMPNLYTAEGGGGLEGIGATVAVNEMMMMSYGGVVRLFAAAPLPLIDRMRRVAAPQRLHANTTAFAFAGLRAEGAFLVSASYTVERVVADVSLLSEAGQPFRLANPWNATFKAFQISSSGQRVPVPVTCAADNVCTFHTMSGAQYELQP